MGSLARRRIRPSIYTWVYNEMLGWRMASFLSTDFYVLGRLPGEVSLFICLYNYNAYREL
jgi:hypothetical protein